MKRYNHQNKNKIILIQPTVGISGEFVKHIPLSLLYVASGLIKKGFVVEIIDNRLCYNSWKTRLEQELTDDVLYVGITVMSGSPIANAIEISKIVKKDREIPVVWGGAHATVLPEQILREDYVDFTVSGSGVVAAAELALAIKGPSKTDDDFKAIKGLGYKVNGNILINKPFSGFEHVHFKDIAYDLINDYSLYGQIGSNEKIFPIYSAYGCPYKCAFCVSPYLYQDFKEKWVALPAEEIVDHIEFLTNKYQASEIYFYDDDSFVDINHIGRVIDQVQERKIHVKMSFRGARVNEVLKMDKIYLDKLARYGTHILHTGIESGSQRILDLFNKGITVDNIITINRKLAENSTLIAAYNWIVGTPTETLEDIASTRKIICQLIKENHRCFIFEPNKFRPLPGTELSKLALEHGYQFPEKLTDWIDEELQGDKSNPWYTKEMDEMIKMMQVTSYFIDRKETLLLKEKSIKNIFISVLLKLYRPIAILRFKYGITNFLIEYPVYQFFVKRFRK